MTKEPRSIHNDDIRRFAATALPLPTSLSVATALIIPTVAPTTVASSSRQIGPDGLAAGWTPAARDLPRAGGSCYLVLDDAPVGGRCRIGVLTPHPGTAADVAHVWTDCTGVRP